MTAIIQARGLVKSFGSVVALDGLDLDVHEGTVLGLLGPNGSGKTTTVSILATLERPDAGSAVVAGADVLSAPQEVRERIGLSGQYAAVDENLTGLENLYMIGRLYGLGRRRARARARELLERFELTEAARRPVRTYSGGMRRRLDLAGALVAAPPVVFLDEPTTGLDPRSRNTLWDLIRELVQAGTTVLLTTQYLEEADQLADQVVVIDEGRQIAKGTPDELKATIGGERIELVVASEADVDTAMRTLDRFALDDVRRDGRSLTAGVDGGVHTLTAALNEFARLNIELRDIGLRRPSLDDVFLALTGRATEAPARHGDKSQRVEAA